MSTLVDFTALRARANPPPHDPHEAAAALSGRAAPPLAMLLVMPPTTEANSDLAGQATPLAMCLQLQASRQAHEPPALQVLPTPGAESARLASWQRQALEQLHLGLQHYLGQTRRSQPPSSLPRQRGGLAPWQESAAKDLMHSRLESEVGLTELAELCGVSVSHFVRAFKRSTGLPPHRWLLEQRVERAKTLLRQPSGLLAEIAVSCGFADQSHFTRVFRRLTGASPGAWRRSPPPAVNPAVS